MHPPLWPAPGIRYYDSAAYPRFAAARHAPGLETHPRRRGGPDNALEWQSATGVEAGSARIGGWPLASGLHLLSLGGRYAGELLGLQAIGYR